MNAATKALTEQLADPKSAKRRSAAKKIRTSGNPEAGPILLAALQKELGDQRTWETQYQMIMALGHCLHFKANDFLEALSHEGRIESVQSAIGDTLFRLSDGLEGDMGKVEEFIERNDPELIQGAFQAMAVQRIVPVSENSARRIVDYGCSLKLGENDWAVIWLLRAVPGWPSHLIEPLLTHWGRVDFREQQQIHTAVQFARETKYCKWSPL